MNQNTSVHHVEANEVMCTGTNSGLDALMATGWTDVSMLNGQELNFNRATLLLVVPNSGCIAMPYVEVARNCFMLAINMSLLPISISCNPSALLRAAGNSQRLGINVSVARCIAM